MLILVTDGLYWSQRAGLELRNLKEIFSIKEKNLLTINYIKLTILSLVTLHRLFLNILKVYSY